MSGDHGQSDDRATDATIDPAFCDREPIEVARDLIGMLLVGRGASGVIVETEAYHPREPASHSHRGETPRNRALFGPAGTAYVYFTYGMHHCFNVVCGPPGEGSAVLIRALVPVEGLEVMRERRSVGRRGTVPGFSASVTDIPDRLLCAGPARLVQALGITREDDGAWVVGPQAEGRVPRIVRDDDAALAAGVDTDAKIVCGPRIGITQATDLDWRCALAGSRYLSKPLLRS